MKKLIKMISSCFYLGCVPYMSGTAASAAALGLYFLFSGNGFFYTLLMIFITILGFCVVPSAEKMFGEKDPEQIVIDEVAGMLLALWGMRLPVFLVIMGFFIFRALDALKVYPADKIEKSCGAWGIMGDDLVAGLYTNLVLQIVSRLIQ
ncbi:MAG: phosphatidylglycerophosphatase A [Candidatus Omnitrophota bacterium]